MKKLSIVAFSVLSALSTQALAERVIVQVDNDKKGIIKALVNKTGGQVNIDSNGFVAATFDSKDLSSIKGLLNNPHIKLIEVDQPRKLLAQFNDDVGNPATEQLTPYAVYQSQADQVSFDASAGMKVCVIDSGLDHTNQDFIWNRITGDNDSGTGNWNDHGGPHGTHVAGTIGAADNNMGVVGMAPGVDMHIIKVFNAEGWGYSSDLAHAANLCADAGSNIISMSLGGGGANSTEENAFNDFVANGGLVVAAAGNDGNNVRSYPAGYSSVVMVGANDADNNIADFSQYPSCTTGRGKKQRTDETICVEVTAGGVDTLSTYPADMATSSSLSADSVAYASSAMENSGSESGSTYFMGTAEAIDANAAGKVCIIDRGNISFHDKVKNCEDSNGIAAVIINNEAGMLYGTLGDTNATTIPAVGAAFEDRAAITSASTASVDISTSDYGYMSGTSMATPAVSGVAALVWSNFPSCTGEEIRSALKATAQDSGAAGHDVNFGHGIVKAKAASDYLTANGCAGGDNGGGEPGGDFTLSANGYKVKGSQRVDLTWAGSSAANVDVYRDGSVIATTSNNGSYTDNLNRKGGGSYDYQICDAGTSTCTTTVTVNF
ncbi:S8 family serine peptidase [Thalassotalea sp. M1531]|uniref:S8 family serine peptidase n=1 Tax=Thalassotalea algicola TaxID=2716224 RepID=A0A7Y0L9G5_9GAMM|nr:S8 family serine peptidase [Thalassotalea algicola]NMP30405.1 S8 family serine peptidase [Thalassotalea algicola]